MSLLIPDSGLLFWMVLSFGIVFFIVAKWGFPVITKMVEERKSYIDKSLLAADEANHRLEEVKILSEKMLEETRAQQLVMLRETAQSKEQILADAKETAITQTQKLIEEAQKQIRLERAAITADLRSQVAIMAVNVAEKILRSELKEKNRQEALMNTLLDEAWHNKLGV
jgi:F-type H+-transporting ATPase subunit b